ncbi:MAG: site-specific integrase [Thermoproteota archaeon]|nr:site-specific integrase [Thermoproteota archaeon]
MIHFYDINDVNVRRKKIARFMSNGDRILSVQQQQQQEGQGSGEKPYTREEMARLLEYADIRSRVMILLMCSSGMRIGALPFLKVGHLTLVPEHDLYQIHVDAYSKEDDYFTFCTPECRKAIDSYLQFRRQCGENITGKSPLLRREFDKEDIFKIANNVRPLTVYAVRKTINEVVYDSGLRKPLISVSDIKSKIKNNRCETALTHGFRKYFGTWCRHVGVADSYVKWLSGRELGGSEDSYFLPQPDSGGIYRDMLEGHEHGRGPGYLDAIEFLTINEENKLRRENQMLKVNKSEIEQLKEKAAEYEAFKSHIDPQLQELQRQIVAMNQKIGRKDPNDLTADIELYKKAANDPLAIEEVSVSSCFSFYSAFLH